MLSNKEDALSILNGTDLKDDDDHGHLLAALIHAVLYVGDQLRREPVVLDPFVASLTEEQKEAFRREVREELDAAGRRQADVERRGREW